MRNDNYPSASEMVRNVSGIRVPHQVLMNEGKFRIVKFEAPYYQGMEYWVINEKGFMWEPADNLQVALAYLESPEALEYQGS